MAELDDAPPSALADGVVNLKQAAATLGVHYMTVYRYVRQGRLAAERVGTEWRVSAEALAVFQNGPSPPAPRRRGLIEDGVAWDRRLECCLIAGDETAAWAVIEKVLAAGHSPTYCYLDVVAAALSTIGDRPAMGDLEIADQHLATAVAVRLVARLGARFRRPGRSRGTAVFGAPPGEFHGLPIAIVSDLIRLQGYDVLELGANVPGEAFVSAVSRTPRLLCVGIGISQLELLNSVQSVVDAIRIPHPDVPIIVGGFAVTASARADLRGVTAVANDGRHTVAIVESLASSRAARSA